MSDKPKPTLQRRVRRVTQSRACLAWPLAKEQCAHRDAAARREPSPSRKEIRTAFADAGCSHGIETSFGDVRQRQKKSATGRPSVDIDRRAKGVELHSVRASAAGRTGLPGIDSLLPHGGMVARVPLNAVNDFMSWLFGIHERAWLLRRWLM